MMTNITLMTPMTNVMTKMTLMMTAIASVTSAVKVRAWWRCTGIGWGGGRVRSHSGYSGGAKNNTREGGREGGMEMPAGLVYWSSAGLPRMHS